MKNLGRKLIFLSNARGITYKDVARVIKLPENIVKYIYSGYLLPNMKYLALLSGYFAVELEELKDLVEKDRSTWIGKKQS